MSYYLFKSLLLCGGLSTLLACQVGKDSVEKQKGAEAAWLSSMSKIVKEGDVRIDFYGNVLDQYGHPVEGAEVFFQMTRSGLNPANYFLTVDEFSIKTDAQGSFSLRNKTGQRISVTEIERKGYEFSSADTSNVTSFAFGGPYKKEYLFVPDRKNPIIYHLRKKGETALLFDHGVNFPFPVKESGKEMGLDLIRDADLNTTEMKTLVSNGDPVVCDLKAKATFNPKTHTWSVVLSPGNPSGGIIVSNQLLYEAPKDGYKPNYTFTPTSVRGRGNDMYLYLRSREPFLYTRIKFNDNFHASPDYFAFGGEAVTNPYGDRILDQATDLPFEVRHSLKEEVMESFRHKNRPPKPDLQKLVQEAEKKKPQSQPLFKR